MVGKYGPTYSQSHNLLAFTQTDPIVISLVTNLRGSKSNTGNSFKTLITLFLDELKTANPC